MITSEPQQPPRSVLSRAASGGMMLGFYITVLVAASALSMQGLAMAAVLVWAGSIYLPFFLYRILRSSNAECGFNLSFAELWAEGIASFFLGSLMPALIAYVALRFFAPDFIANVFDSTVESCRALGVPEGDMWADTLVNIRNRNGLPRPTDVVAQIISFNLMSGMAISFFTAAWLKVRYASAERRNRYLAAHPRN